MKSRFERISELLSYASSISQNISKYAEVADDIVNVEDNSSEDLIKSDSGNAAELRDESERDKLISAINKNPNLLTLIVRDSPDLFFEDKLYEVFPDKIETAMDNFIYKYPEDFLKKFSDKPFATKQAIEGAALRAPEAFLANNQLRNKFADIAKQCALSLYSVGDYRELAYLDALDYLDSIQQFQTISGYLGRYGRNPNFGISDQYPKIDVQKYGNHIDKIINEFKDLVDDRGYGLDTSRFINYITSLSSLDLSEESRQVLLNTIKDYLNHEYSQKIIWYIISSGITKNLNQNFIDEMINVINGAVSKEGIIYDDIFYNFNDNMINFFQSNSHKLKRVIDDIVNYANPSNVLKYMLPIFPEMKEQMHNVLLETASDSAHTLINEWELLERDFPDVLKKVMEIYVPYKASYITPNIIKLMQKDPEHRDYLLKKLALKSPAHFLDAINDIAKKLGINESEYSDLILQALKDYSKNNPIHFLNSTLVDNSFVTIDILKDAIISYLSSHASDGAKLYHIYNNHKNKFVDINKVLGVEKAYNIVADKYPEIESLMLKKIQELNPSLFLTLDLQGQYPDLYEEALRVMSEVYPLAFISQMFEKVKNSHQHLIRKAAENLNSDVEFFRFRLDRYNPESAQKRIEKFAKNHSSLFIKYGLLDDYPEIADLAVASLANGDTAEYPVFFNNHLYKKFPQHLDVIANRILSLAETQNTSAINAVIADLLGDTERNPFYKVDLKLFSQDSDKLNRALRAILIGNTDAFLQHFLSKYEQFVNDNINIVINKVGAVRFLKKAAILYPQHINTAVKLMAEFNPLKYLTCYKTTTEDLYDKTDAERELNILIEAVQKSESQVDVAIESLKDLGSGRDLLHFVSGLIDTKDGQGLRIIDLYPEYKAEILLSFASTYHDSFLSNGSKYSEFYTPELLSIAAFNRYSKQESLFRSKDRQIIVQLKDGSEVYDIDLLTEQQIKKLSDSALSIVKPSYGYQFWRMFDSYIFDKSEYVRTSVIRKAYELLDSSIDFWNTYFQYNAYYEGSLSGKASEIKDKLVEVMYEKITITLNDFKDINIEANHFEAEYFKMRTLLGRLGDSGSIRKDIMSFIKQNFGNLLEPLTNLIARKLSATQIISSGIISIFSGEQLNKLLSSTRADANTARAIDDYDVAIKFYDFIKNDKIPSIPNQIPTTNNNIRVSESIYQDQQRPDEFLGTTRYELSQNNIKPSKILFDIGKKLIHAGDGVNHTTVGISGFTSLWCLGTFVVENDIDTFEPTDIKLVIEQYQSDYPVVLDRIFMGNVRDPDTGKVTNKDDSAYQKLVNDYGDEQARDAKRHFAIISQNYPYIALINAIKVAMSIGLSYIYVMKDAPQFANIANAEKASRLYSLIPQQVSDELERVKGYECFKIRANDESIAKLSKSLDMGADYDYSLTPLQNASLRKKDENVPQQRSEWKADDIKIDKLNKIRSDIKALLPAEVDVPEFNQPKDALKFLNTEVNKKIVPSSIFKNRFSEVVSELGLLARANFAYERMIKLASINEKLCLINLDESNYNKYKLRLNTLLRVLKNVH